MSEFRDIKEFIYFDIEKAFSIYSQLEDGLPKEENSSTTTGEKLNPELSANVLGLKAGISGETISTQHSSKSHILHHNVLNRLEDCLNDAGLLSNLNSISSQDKENILQSISGSSYIKTSGPSTFENLRRLNKMLPGFNKTIEFINSCSFSGIPTFESLTKEGISKSEAQKQIAALKKIAKENGAEKLDDKMLKGMVKFLEEYLEVRIVFRVQPFEDSPDVQIRAQLRDSCFVVDDEGHLSFCYGLNPKMNITIVGLITSMPAKDESDEKQYQPSKGLEGATGQIEEQLRSFIEAFENLKSMVSFDRYPIITVYPIAIYRSIPYSKK